MHQVKCCFKMMIWISRWVKTEKWFSGDISCLWIIFNEVQQIETFWQVLLFSFLFFSQSENFNEWVGERQPCYRQCFFWLYVFFVCWRLINQNHFIEKGLHPGRLSSAQIIAVFTVCGPERGGANSQDYAIISTKGLRPLKWTFSPRNIIHFPLFPPLCHFPFKMSVCFIPDFFFSYPNWWSIYEWKSCRRSDSSKQISFYLKSIRCPYKDVWSSHFLVRGIFEWAVQIRVHEVRSRVPDPSVVQQGAVYSLQKKKKQWIFNCKTNTHTQGTNVDCVCFETKTMPAGLGLISANSDDENVTMM